MSEAEAQQAGSQPNTTQSNTDAPDTATSTTESRMSELEARLADLERQLADERNAATDYMQRWQRAAADFSNFKRRVQQEQEQLRGLAAAEALTPVLHALDSFERAFATLPDSLRTFSWIDGVALIDLQLRRALDVHGITQVAAELGSTFDPTRHQAMGMVESSTYAEGTIAEVLQRGYEVRGVLLRPALVQVARVPRQEAQEANLEVPPETNLTANAEEVSPAGPETVESSS